MNISEAKDVALLLEWAAGLAEPPVSWTETAAAAGRLALRVHRALAAGPDQHEVYHGVSRATVTHGTCADPWCKLCSGHLAGKRMTP